MKAILERHKEELTARERLAVWSRVRDAQGARSRRPRLWLGLGATGAVAALLMLTIHHRNRHERMMAAVSAPQETTADRLEEERQRKLGYVGGKAEGDRAGHTFDKGTKDPMARSVSPRGDAPQVGAEQARPTEDGRVSGLGASAPPASSQTSPPAGAAASSDGDEVASSTSAAKIDVAYEFKHRGIQTIADALGKQTEPVVDNDPPLFTRGGRASETETFVEGVPAPRALGIPSPISERELNAPPVHNVYGGTSLPNDAAYDAMFFEHYGVNPFIPTEEDALSTFAVDVDAASYTVARRYIEEGHLPPKDAIRVEEFVNTFRQGYPDFENDDFRILLDGAASPFGHGYQLLRVGIKSRQIESRDRKPARLVFVIDVSGSMAREDRLELVKRALRVLVDRLRPSDSVGIVVYGSTGRAFLEPTSLEERESILAAIDGLHPDGSTNAEEGLLLGYEMARRNYRDGAINRIILCSDGVANVGRTGPDSILERVRSQADRGITLSAIGFGMGNYNDVLMEQLADKGDGNYYYVDDIKEARRVFEENLTGTLQTIARDAKVQVEFDARNVTRYRLLGFENRDVADRDFRNDAVDAGEIGAGHEVTALYEVKLADGVRKGRVATVRFRYADPDRSVEGEPAVRETAESIDAADLTGAFERAPARLRLGAVVAEFAEILRGSYWARENRVADLVPHARRLADDLHSDAAVADFARLVERAAELSASDSPEEREDRGPDDAPQWPER